LNKFKEKDVASLRSAKKVATDYTDKHRGVDKYGSQDCQAIDFEFRNIICVHPCNLWQKSRRRRLHLSAHPSNMFFHKLFVISPSSQFIMKIHCV